MKRLCRLVSTGPTKSIFAMGTVASRARPRMAVLLGNDLDVPGKENNRCNDIFSKCPKFEG